MNLYIHFGIYKTGSSFLQTMCGRNRELLEKSGYYFPKSTREKDLLAGRISPGNGNGISVLLKNGDQEKISSLVGEWASEAIARRCNKILISAEAIIHPISTHKGLDTLIKAVEQNGIEKIRAFGYFRDLTDHCLSTYKHRAKRGTIPDFEAWVANSYETVSVLKKFLQVFKKYPIEWKFRKYSKNANFMATSFFQDWLKIDVLPPIPEKKQINISLSLSELLLIQQIAHVTPSLVSLVYQELIAIHGKDKADDNVLENAYRQIIGIHLSRGNEVIEALNILLPETEQLQPIPKQNQNSAILEEASLTKMQMQGLAQALKKAQNPKHQLIFLAKQIYRKLRAK